MPGARYDVRDRVVFITGGARGIGADAAERLLARGAKVALIDRDEDELERRAAALGPSVLAISADITDRAAIDYAVTATLDSFGAIDVVIANAGLSGTGGTVAAVAPGAFG